MSAFEVFSEQIYCPTAETAQLIKISRPPLIHFLCVHYMIQHAGEALSDFYRVHNVHLSA